jgi:hypothetical protein
MRVSNIALYEFGVTQNEFDLVSHLGSIQSGLPQYARRIEAYQFGLDDPEMTATPKDGCLIRIIATP